MPNLISFAASVAALAHEEQLRTQSLNHLSSLYDARETELVLRRMLIFYVAFRKFPAATLDMCHDQ